MFGVLGWPAVLVASEPKFLGDVVAGGHLLLLGRSTFLRHVDVFDVLLGEAIKNFVFFVEKGFGFKLHPGCVPLPTFGAAETHQEAALGAGDEDDRETLA